MAPRNPTYGGQRLIVERATSDEILSIRIYVPNAIARAVGDSLHDNVGTISQALYEGMGGGAFPDSQMLAANQEIARRAQKAIVAGWRARLPLKSPPYRRGSDPNKSRLSGKLGESLASSDMISGTTARGISFLNTTKLAQDARHWYRVNYGAFGYNVSSPRRPKAYPVTVDGHTMFTLQDEHQPAANSWLPRRFMFVDNQFIPRRGPADMAGGGHRAALFTDLGFKSVAANADPVYREMLFRYFRRGGLAKRFQAKGVSRRVTSRGRIV